MWNDLSSGLKDWLLTLGFDRENLSDAEIENEFSKLTPPEMRDIWRNIMVHVVPIEKKRYIKKVLLLEELKKLRSENKLCQPLPRNLESVEDLEMYMIYSKAQQQLDERELLINNSKARVKDLAETYEKLKEERRKLVDEVEKENHVNTLIRLKCEKYEKLNKELIDTHDCLEYVSSTMMNLSDNEEKVLPTDELMKNLLAKVHEFVNRRNSLSDEELISEQKKLHEDISNLTMNVSSSALQKKVIHLLENSLNALLTIAQQVKERKKEETTDDCGFEWNPAELKKLSVRTYVENHHLQVKLKAEKEKLHEEFSAVVFNLQRQCRNEEERTVVKNWLETQFLKHQMTSRLKFLANAEAIARNEMSALSNVAFSNATERNVFLKPIQDMKNKMVELEKEIGCKLSFLSNKSIDQLVNYQQSCKDKVEPFARNEGTSNSEENSLVPKDMLKTEIELLRKLDLSSLRGSNSDSVLSENHVDYARRQNFLFHMESACDNFFQRVNHLNFSEALVAERILKIESSEKDFQTTLRTLLDEAKDNLKLVEKEAETCTKNLQLRDNFSVDELIPEHMVVEKYTFSQWKEKFRACWHHLPK